MHVVVASTRTASALARATSRHAAAWATVHVLDVDGSYRPVADEHVLRPADLGVGTAALHRLAAGVGAARLAEVLLPDATRHVLARDVGDADALLALHPGVLLLTDPAPLAADLPPDGVAATLRAPCTPDDGRWPDLTALGAGGAADPHLVVLRPGADRTLDAWERAARTSDARWLDVVLLDEADARVLRGHGLLLGPDGLRDGQQVTRGADGTLLLDGTAVVALDASGVEPGRAWWWSADPLTDARGRLGEHPVLAELVAGLAAQLADDDADGRSGRDATDAAEDLVTTSLGVPVDEPLRLLYAADDGSAPDPFDPDDAPALLAWLVDPAPGGGPGRYLQRLHASRADLRAAFPAVPGGDEAGYRRWLAHHAAAEGLPAAIIEPALRAEWPAPVPRGRPTRGVEVIGFLDGELGIGESARLVVGALDAAGVRHAEHPVARFLDSPRRPTNTSTAGPPLDSALICVNADLTPSVAASVPHLLTGRYRIGMWYWETEDFPPSQHGGFSAVDEVWVATEFVRRAIAPHSPVPVVTLTPPLPQRRATPLPSRSDLGLPDRPLLLFSFDHLSTFERKNPLGLIDAFARAFSPGEGPMLVVKSINARRRPADAERLRLAVGAQPDVLLLEDYLDPAARDGLVAACDAYVSLHRSEGLGLTMAEAMAWGKPVIATGYGGNLQFMTERNSVLVPWAAVPVGPDATPYPPEGTWADPDLDTAAAAMRSVLDRPDEARARGERAAADIATLHSPEVAGRAIAARLAEIGTARRLRVVGTSRLRGAVRDALRRRG